MGGGFRGWLAGFGRRETVAVAVLGVAIAAGAALWYVRSLPRGITPVREVPAATPVAAPSSTPAPLLVHVAGWVRAPGVYEMLEGQRVIDAIERAGGARKGADLDALNLAAPLSDAQQVLVPRRGRPPPASAAGGAAAAEAVLDLNAATQEQLEELPGIGPVLAGAILEYREEHGRFGSVEELLEVSGIGDARLEDLRDRVRV